MEKPFIHLHNHSDYSLLDGACKTKLLVAQAVKFGMPALALTDHGNMFGALEFYTEARRVGLKPIIGMEAYITTGDMKSRTAQDGAIYNHLTLLAQNKEGYHNLVELTSIGYLEGFYYRPRIGLDILEQRSKGLLALSGCAKGPVADLIWRNKMSEARQMAADLRDLFGKENFFIEIMDHGLEIERKVLPQLIEIAHELQIPLVATNDTHYLLREHHEAQDALVCIQTGKVLDDPKRLHFATQELYLKSAEEMYAIFPDHQEALKRTVEIAQRCEIKIKFGNNYLPAFPLPEGFTEIQLLEKLACEGAQRRYGKTDETVKQRLDYEIEIIKHTGFPGYFLIVSDIVSKSRELGIPVGPGRGSAAGSLVSYCLGITNIDPLEYNLLFERFLNPERISMPDIDIDFADRDRDKIIHYIRDKYGKENVAQIITFGTMAAHAVVRDVGRVLGLAYDKVDRIAKMIPEELGMTLDKALEMRPDIAEMAQKEASIKKLLEISKVLEGVNRHASTHAAGVVITPTRLTDYLPLFRSTRNDDILTQYDKDWVEKIGLLKIDILGLRTLTVIQDTLRMIEELQGEKIDLDKLELNDPETFSIFANGETVGIFQFESPGMREYLRKLKPENIDDIIAMNALYRPGPLGSEMVEDFIKCKQGQVKVSYHHPILEPILKETYGVIVYQEQVMRIASEMAGFTPGGADHLRRAMGKKKKEVMEQQKERFLAGAAERGVDLNVAEKVYELMAHFAGYGFNKSHSAGYAILAYQTAWLKVHYPMEFMASTLTSVMNKSDKLAVFLEECRRMKIKVLPPDVNESGLGFTVIDEGIRFGLAAIKNVGKGAVEAILEARKEGGPFRCLGDFLYRLDSRVINRRLVESLICSGAMNSLEGEPEQLLKVLEPTMEFCARLEAERSSGQMGLFSEGTAGLPAGDAMYPPLPKEYQKWDPLTPLEYEKEYLGFYISGHPLDKYAEELNSFTNANTINYNKKSADRQTLLLGGMIGALRTFFDRKGRECCIITLEDHYGSVDIFIFSDVYERHREIIHSGALVLVNGKLSRRGTDDKGKVIADWLIALEQVRDDEGVGIELSLDTRETSADLLKLLQQILLRHSGKNPVYLRVVETNGDYILRSRELFANPSDKLLEELRKVLGEKKVGLAYHPRSPQSAPVFQKKGMQALLKGNGNSIRASNG
ncbi:MAG TPA: DNA polymerase III subunit alpha [archaeon]|nr:DNA polymerase III subunit alpha [archaeon]